MIGDIKMNKNQKMISASGQLNYYLLPFCEIKNFLLCLWKETRS